MRDIGAQQYADRLADALTCLDLTWDFHPSPRMPGCCDPCSRPAASILPRAKPLKRREVSRAARDRLYTAFRRSEPGQALGRDTQLARLFIDYGSDHYLDGLHWSPIVVELFLTQWPPRKVSLFDDEAEPVAAACCARGSVSSARSAASRTGSPRRCWTPWTNTRDDFRKAMDGCVHLRTSQVRRRPDAG